MIHVSGPRGWVVGLRRSRRGITLAAAAAMAMILCGGVGAVDYTDWWYCNSIEDFLDCRPYHANTSYMMEPILLQWGKEQGVRECQGEILPEKRREALYAVYRLIRKKCLPDAVVASEAPDAGIKVTAGEPRVVMFAPEGRTADREGNIKKLGHLGPSLAVEGRWGQYMFPEVNRLRSGHILVRVNVGGDADRNYQDYISDDGGLNWTHVARYFEDEMPARDWGVKTLPDGEEIKVSVPNKDPKNIFEDIPITITAANLKTYAGGYYRLGDLPREQQCVPLLTRKPGQEQWTEEKAYLDPDILVKNSIPNPLTSLWIGDKKILPDGSIARVDFKQGGLLKVSDVGPDGKIKPQPHRFLRSFDRGRTWKVSNEIPTIKWWPFRPDLSTVRPHLLAFPNGNWVVSFRHNGLYYSGGGPLIVIRSTDQGKTWSKPKAIRMPAVNPNGLVLENGIAAMVYQRPGVYMTFCADGKGEKWGNDITLVKGGRSERDQNSCCNGTFLPTGKDKFLYVYTKWDVPDPWGQPRQAVIAQEFIVSRK